MQCSAQNGGQRADLREERVDHGHGKVRIVLLLRLPVVVQHKRLRVDGTAFAERFRQQSGFALKFTPKATSRLVKLAFAAGKTVRGYCEEHFKDFEYGLKLVHRENPQEPFEMDEEQVASPQATLTQWIKDSFPQ